MPRDRKNGSITPPRRFCDGIYLQSVAVDRLCWPCRVWLPTIPSSVQPVAYRNENAMGPLESVSLPAPLFSATRMTSILSSLRTAIAYCAW